MSKVAILGTVGGLMDTTAIVCLFRKHVSIVALQRVGKYSLDIYLLHTFITAANRKLLFRCGIDWFVPNIVVNFTMGLCLPIIASIILKRLGIYKYIFKPFGLTK